MNIDKKHPDYEANRRRWRVGDLLMGGTYAMREARDVTLPREERESDDAYRKRVNRSVLYNAYRMTVDTLKKKPFSEPVQIKEPEKLPLQWEFLNECMVEMLPEMVEHELRFGKTINIVSMPNVPEGMSEIDRIKSGINPEWTLLHPDSYISWYSDDLGLARIKIEYEDEVLGDDGEPTTVRKIDVITREDTKTYIESGKDEGGWVLENTKPNPIDRISIVIGGSIYDAPVLENLSELNLQHFRKSSDKDNILHMACCPFLLFAGWDKDDIEATVSVNNAYVSSDTDAKIDWVEVSGTGIEQTIKDIEQLEAKLIAAGADIITEKKATTTATENVIDNQDRMSTLQAVVVKVEKTFTQVVSLMAEWLNTEDPEIKISIFKDFNITQKVKDEVQMLLEARRNGDISRETYLKELKRRQLFDDSFDVDMEMGRIEDAGEL